MGRPRQFNTENALKMATRHFWTHGYSATSIEDLMQCMALSKSSLYQAFGGKKQLLLRSVDYYQQQLCQRLQQQLDTSENGLDFFRQLLDEVVSDADPGSERAGCLFVNLANEIGPHDAEISKALSQGIISVEPIFIAALEKAKQQQLIDADIDNQQTARDILASISGMRTLIRAGVQREGLKTLSQSIMNHLTQPATHSQVHSAESNQ